MAGAVLAGLAGLALVVAAVVLLTRSDDTAPVQIVAPEPTTPAASAPTEAPTEPVQIRVQISGAVRLPGVYEMRDGDRVIDAVAAAGGAAVDADLSRINLALRVQDEAHYHVPFVGETPPPTVIMPTNDTPSNGSIPGSIPGDAASTDGSSSPASLIDLNTATGQDLESLPGIGPVMAGRIISHREANGPFLSVDELENVSGIGPKTMESIRPLVTVSGSP